MTNYRRALGVFALIWTLGAQAGPEIVPIQERAQGQSLVGANLLNDSLYSNPAASAFTQVYAVEGMFSLPKSFSASVLDTKSQGIGGGVGYFRHFDNGSDTAIQGAKLSLLRQLSPNVGVGLAGKAIWGKAENGHGVSKKDMDVGILAQFSMFTMGLAIRNLFGGTDDLGLKQDIGIGVRYGYQGQVFLSAAMHADWEGFSPYQYGFGFEYLSPYHFGLKAGHRIRPEENRSFWSAGLTFHAPRITLNYAVEFPNQPQDTTEHVMSTTLLF